MVIVARELDTIIVWEKLAKNAFYRNEKLIDSNTNPIDSVSSLGEQLQIYNIYQPWTMYQIQRRVYTESYSHSSVV